MNGDVNDVVDDGSEKMYQAVVWVLSPQERPEIISMVFALKSG